MTDTSQQRLAALYIRSGSPHNTESLSQQEIQLTQRARLDGVEVAQVYKDIGISGHMPVVNRPGLSTLLQDAQQGGFQILYVTDMSRLGRNVGVMNQVFDQLRAAGIQVIATGKMQVC